MASVVGADPGLPVGHLPVGFLGQNEPPASDRQLDRNREHVLVRVRHVYQQFDLHRGKLLEQYEENLDPDVDR